MALARELKSDGIELTEKILQGECFLPRDLEDLPSDTALRHEAMLINEVSLVLAEKRTALAFMRTGLTILALPLSVLSVLVVISRYYEPMKVMFLLGPILTICVLLSGLGFVLITKAFRRISRLSKVLVALKQQNQSLRELCVVMDDLIGPDKDF